VVLSSGLLFKQLMPSRNIDEIPDGVEYALYIVLAMVETKQVWKDSLGVCSLQLTRWRNTADTSYDIYLLFMVYLTTLVRY
jgi:hypothetical protein